MLVSDVQPGDSVMHLHIFILFQILFSYSVSETVSFLLACGEKVAEDADTAQVFLSVESVDLARRGLPF